MANNGATKHNGHPNGRCACIDIGSNTTRLAVIEASGGSLSEVLTQRAFTKISKGLDGGRELSGQKISEIADVVATQADLARSVGVDVIAVVGTAALRKAANAWKLAEVVQERTGLPLRVLAAEDEARLAFVGMTAMLKEEVGDPVAVCDVGGGSTEIAVGSLRGGLEWSRSLELGSATLADTHLRTDPPRADELEDLRADAAGLIDPIELGQRPTSAIAVGGSANGLRRVVGAELDLENLQRALEILTAHPVEELSRRFELDRRRARVLPAGAIVLERLLALLAVPLRAGRGGIREGIVVELLSNASAVGFQPTSKNPGVRA